MKILFIFLMLMVSLNIFCDDVLTEISPNEPLVNESFFVTFKVKATGESEPYISFTPVGAQVLGKKEQGLSIQTIVINGKFTTTKEQSIVYELIADKPGTVYLKNIKVDLGGKSQAVKDVHINVLSTPKKISDAFIEAQVSKTKVYVGEGIDVNYYLYFKTSFSNYDVKDFPKLNKFIKRFRKINSPVETVQYKNEVLKRILTYSARIFPEKAGTATIDPMRVSAQIIEFDYNGFGFGSQRFKNKELSSNKIEIEVLPLPSENVPPGFTGLVGDHEFVFTPGKNKYLINEPIELKLEIKGRGALEKTEAPAIYSDPNLETFDTKSEVTELSDNSAKKVFDYTYLARNLLNIKNRELSLAIFDPATGRYVEKKIQVPSIEVAGGTASSSAGNKIPTQSSVDNQKPIEISNDFLSKWFGGGTNGENKVLIPKPSTALGLVGPIFTNDSSLSNKLLFFNLILAVILGLIGFLHYRENSGEQLSFNSNNAEARILFKKIKKDGLEYSNLYKLLSLIDKKNKMSNGGVALMDIVNESGLSIEAKDYFKTTLEICEQQIYVVNKKQEKAKIESKYFNELLNIL
jgi:hypothetical protein